MSYPPPTLTPGPSRAALIRRIVLVATLCLLLGTCAFSRLMQGRIDKPAAETVIASTDIAIDKAGDVGVIAPAEAVPAAVAAPAAPPVVTEVTPPPPAAPVPAAAPASAADARQPNRWYYVPRLGDGPGAIYSRDGGPWSYAFACALPTRTIEFIAVGIGDPGSFDSQYLRVGGTRQMLDAGYSRDGNGTISSRLPAKAALFDQLAGAPRPIEMQLRAEGPLTVPAGAEIARVVRECRAKG